MAGALVAGALVEGLLVTGLTGPLVLAAGPVVGATLVGLATVLVPVAVVDGPGPVSSGEPQLAIAKRTGKWRMERVEDIRENIRAKWGREIIRQPQPRRIVALRRITRSGNDLSYLHSDQNYTRRGRSQMVGVFIRFTA